MHTQNYLRHVDIEAYPIDTDNQHPQKMNDLRFKITENGTVQSSGTKNNLTEFKAIAVENSSVLFYKITVCQETAPKPL
jgi:hypothetical protein